MAAYKAAYHAEGMAPTSIKVQAWKLVRHPRVAPVIQARLAAAAEMADISTARRLQILSEIVEFDPRELFDVLREPCATCGPEINPQCTSCGGKGRMRLEVRPSDEWSVQAARCVRAVRQRGNGVELVLVDRLVASDQLNRASGCYSERASTRITTTPRRPQLDRRPRRVRMS